MTDLDKNAQNDLPWNSHQASLQSCIQKEVSRIGKMSSVGLLWSNRRTHLLSPIRLSQSAGNTEESRILLVLQEVKEYASVHTSASTNSTKKTFFHDTNFELV